LLMIGVAGCSGASGPVATSTPTLEPAAARGKDLFGRPPAQCATCHSLTPETVIIGPSLAGIATRAESRMDGLDARQYIELSILKPDAYLVEGFPNTMPSDFGKKLTSEELNDLVAYLLTLK